MTYNTQEIFSPTLKENIPASLPIMKRDVLRLHTTPSFVRIKRIKTNISQLRLSICRRISIVILAIF